MADSAPAAAPEAGASSSEQKKLVKVEHPEDALDVHIRFFDVDGDGKLSVHETREALQELGFSKITSAIMAPLLTLPLPKDVNQVHKVRHNDSGTFKKDGKFDEVLYISKNSSYIMPLFRDK
jgi:hypothetical protein